MIKRLMGKISDRRPAATEMPVPTAASLAAATGTCSRPGCTESKGWRCSYRDPKGKRCGWWCKDHLVFEQGQPWCHRHVNTIRELRKRAGSIYEISRLAAIEDRSPRLASLIVEEIDDDVAGALRRIFDQYPGVNLVTDPAIREIQIARTALIEGTDGPKVLRQGTERGWQRGWGVYSNSGYLARVSVRVTTSEPPVVQVLVNSRMVLSTVPDWIAARAVGSPPTDEDRLAFRARVIEAIVMALGVPVETQQELVPH